VMIDFKGSYFEQEAILWGVRWYIAYPISYRQREKILEEARQIVHDDGTSGRCMDGFWPIAAAAGAC